MGRIGPRRQRFEVLPAAPWGLDDLLVSWRTDAAQESDVHDSGAGVDDRRDLQASEPDHH